MAWTWHDRTVSTFGDVITAVGSVATPEEAQEMVATYSAVEPNAALANLAFAVGYTSEPERSRLVALFGPLFNQLPTAAETEGNGPSQQDRIAQAAAAFGWVSRPRLSHVPGIEYRLEQPMNGFQAMKYVVLNFDPNGAVIEVQTNKVHLIVGRSHTTVEMFEIADHELRHPFDD
jgi:hypothetical protein